MKKLIETIKHELQEKGNVVLVTILASSGSTPRGAGARMVVGNAGQLLCGTIGGGAVEFEAQQMAGKLLMEKRSLLHDFLLTPNQVKDLGMVCGGKVSVYFQYISCQQAEIMDVLENILTGISSSQPNWLLTKIQSDGWSMQVFDKSTEACILPSTAMKNKLVQFYMDDVHCFAAPLTNAGFVYIFGGGHISRELVPVLSHIGFRCIVFEDRADFASTDLFPMAEKLIVGDFKDIFSHITISEDDYIVIMTRGHASDYDVEWQVLTTPACYIGAIGSKSKIKFVSDQLLHDGFTESDLKRVHSPIGLPIGGETPAEIALSIAAELVLVRSQQLSSL